MMKIEFDIDIDVANRDELLSKVTHIPASISPTKKHNTGVYFQNVPVDPQTGFCGLDYKQASEVGFLKIDFLNNRVYTQIRDEDHLEQLLNQEPEWTLLENPDVVKELFQIHNYYDLLQQHKPRSIEELSMFLAIMRPSKAHLQGKTWKEIEKSVWIKDSGDQYYFKRSHSLAYSLVIVVQLNLLQENINPLF